MKQYVTEIQAIDPKDGIMKLYEGPDVPGKTLEGAERYCQNNGLGYCSVVGERIELPHIKGCK